MLDTDPKQSKARGRFQPASAGAPAVVHAGFRTVTTAVRGALMAAMSVVPMVLSTACADAVPRDRARVSGQVEATSVRVAGEVGGRIVELSVAEGDRVRQGDVVVRLATEEVELVLRRATAERDQAAAQLSLLRAGAREEDVRQAEAQLDGARADTRAVQAELASAEADLDRFETLLEANSGSRKQRDDARTRRDVAEQRVQAARERERAASEALEKLRAGPRPQEIDAARARVAAAEAQMASFRKSLDDAVVRSPVDGIVTEKLAEPGEVVAPRVALLIVTDLDRAWADVFVSEPDVPRLRVGQEATVHTDAGDAIPGTVTFVSSKAEFTPRNVQTVEERSTLVYRVKVSVDNREGILKEGMPIEAELPLQAVANEQ